LGLTLKTEGFMKKILLLACVCILVFSFSYIGFFKNNVTFSDLEDTNEVTHELLNGVWFSVDKNGVFNQDNYTVCIFNRKTNEWLSLSSPKQEYALSFAYTLENSMVDWRYISSHKQNANSQKSIFFVIGGKSKLSIKNNCLQMESVEWFKAKLNGFDDPKNIVKSRYSYYKKVSKHNEPAPYTGD